MSRQSRHPVSWLASLIALAATAQCQKACTLTPEKHPPLSWTRFSADGSSTKVAGSVTVDANWRWTHLNSSTTNCYTGNEWDTKICPNSQACTQACCIDGADYSGTYGVTSTDDALTLKFVTKGPYSTNIGSRLYLLADDNTYEGFTLLGNEFTFDVDASNLPCGLNGALYFVSMDLDGGKSKYDNAGALFGVGYCDSQCPRDLKFIAGKANVENWVGSSTDPNAGLGLNGACCPEMDIWEANSISTALTPHPCTNPAFHTCQGNACGGTYSDTRYAGDCDPDGCDFNPFRQGDENFYGPGKTVDTTKKITVVTQFVAEGGELSEIRRHYVQDGKVIANSFSKVADVPKTNSITSAYCDAQKKAFGDKNVFAERGGFSSFTTAIKKPMVLVMSLWDDHKANALWLDSTYPVGATGPGAKRGTCGTDTGVPGQVEKDSPGSSVVYSNIKFGPIGSTFNAPKTSVKQHKQCGS